MDYNLWVHYINIVNYIMLMTIETRYFEHHPVFHFWFTMEELDSDKCIYRTRHEEDFFGRLHTILFMKKQLMGEYQNFLIRKFTSKNSHKNLSLKKVAKCQNQ